ncbi:WD40 repeat-like protein [Suillus brevipes Sb2]|nr:WD40 repeat-like protein [Suillus brevipes Sb2]
MASTSTQAVATADKSILIPVITLEGHKPWYISMQNNDWDLQVGSHEVKHISCISYFPDGKQMISASRDKTIRRWDLRKGKEIEEAREVYEYVEAVGVSRNGRWIVIAGLIDGIKVSEVETGIVRTFYEGSSINCIDISADSTLLAGGSWSEVQVWNLDTGELVAGPFDIGSDNSAEALRLSGDSRKLAVSSKDVKEHCHLQVWDVQTQKLDVQKSAHSIEEFTLNLPIFWTTNDKSIVAAFNSTADKRFDGDYPTLISEFDASTLKTVGAPFKHFDPIESLALSSDCVLLVSCSYPAIKLWAFESRQLLASFDVESFFTLLLSPDSRQLAYTSYNDIKIYICDIPANILASIESVYVFPHTSIIYMLIFLQTNKFKHSDLLNSDATRHTVRRKPVIIPVRSSIPRPLPTSDPHPFPRFLRKLLPSTRTAAAHTDEPSNPLDFPATLPLPRSHIVSGTDIIPYI